MNNTQQRAEQGSMLPCSQGRAMIEKTPANHAAIDREIRAYFARSLSKKEKAEFEKMNNEAINKHIRRNHGRTINQRV